MTTEALGTELVDWNVEADAANIRPGSIELQRTVHRRWHDKIVSRPPEGWLRMKPLWRVRVIDKLEVRLGRPIAGEVLEIGAGSATSSAFAARRPDVTRVTAMDYDRFCVEEMMPAVFDKFEAPVAKIRRALGSYNRIPDRDFYDLVIAVGALHHAEDLSTAFSAAFDALKPGGLMLVSDVCEPDSMSNRLLIDRYETVVPDSKTSDGREVRMKDNGDHWYRLSEWLVAARNAGFECLPYLFDTSFGEPADDAIFARPRQWRSFQTPVFQPYFADRGQFDPLLLILQRPADDGSTDAIPRDLRLPLSAEPAAEAAVPPEVAAPNRPETTLLQRLWPRRRP